MSMNNSYSVDRETAERGETGYRGERERETLSEREGQQFPGPIEQTHN